MNIPTILLLIYAATLLVLAILTPLFSPFFRARKLWGRAIVVDSDDELSDSDSDVKTNEDIPDGISMVIVEHDSAFRLEQVLPKYLSQDYKGDYQVVVVIDQNDSDSEDVLKRHSSDPHLYYTRLPITSRYLSRKKLGITLGIRAAKYDWVVVTDVHCAPSSDNWLTRFAAHCDDDKNMVLGMTPYENDAPVYYRFDHLRTMLYHLEKALNGRPFSTNQSVVAIRKGEFFENKGFSGNLEFTRAEYEFLVNKFGKEGTCALAIEPEAWLTQYNPNPKRWRARQLFTLDALKGMRNVGMFRFKTYLDNDLIHVFNLLVLALMAFGAFLVVNEDTTPFDGNVISSTMPYAEMITKEHVGLFCIVMSVFVWLVSMVERCLIYRRLLGYFTNINPLMAVLMEWTMTIRNVVLRIRYAFSDKNDFVTHKL